MDFDTTLAFLENAFDRLQVAWQIRDLNNIASLRVPDIVTGKQDTVLRADINTLWTQWFLESICDPEKFTDSYPGYGYIVYAVKQEVPSLFAHIEPSKHNLLIKQIARLLDQEIHRRRNKERIQFDRSIRDSLWDVYSSRPRCWICGHRFSEWAINKFLGNRLDDSSIKLYDFVDYMKPRGLYKRDLQIEIDHVFPFSEGGSDDLENLRIICGWCNLSKSNRISIYDVSAKPLLAHHPKLGRVSIPHPFWTVRLLSLHRKCEHPEGCNKTVDNSELTVTARHVEGAMNPINLRITCFDHDNLGPNRFISRSAALEMLKK